MEWQRKFVICDACHGYQRTTADQAMQTCLSSRLELHTRDTDQQRGMRASKNVHACLYKTRLLQSRHWQMRANTFLGML